MVLKAANDALKLMRTGGYPILEEVVFEVDEKLQIMGYTTERDGKTLITVSGWSLKTDMVTGLLIHELSHVYRTQTFHPSHNFSLHNKVLNKLGRGDSDTLRNIINHIQDIYADDISFPVYMEKHQKGNLSEFFSGWVLPPTTNKAVNAERLVSAAFASANLERHKVKDGGNKLTRSVENFLTEIDKNQAEKYNYFKDTLINLPENITEKQFEIFLEKFLGEFGEIQ